MKKMEIIIQKLFSFVFIFLLASSCAKFNYNLPNHPAYIANVANVNTTTAPSQFANTTYFTYDHLENQSTFSITQNRAAQANFYISNGFTLGELAYSYKKNLTDNLAFTNSAGYGYGIMNYANTKEYTEIFGSNPKTFDKNVSSSSSLHKFYTQPSLSIASDDRTVFSFGGRLSYLHHKNYKYDISETSRYGTGSAVKIYSESIDLPYKNSFTFDPFISIKKEGEILGVQFQLIFCTPLKYEDKQGQFHLLSAGFAPVVGLGFTWKIGEG